jgi:hypothetical protein
MPATDMPEPYTTADGHNVIKSFTVEYNDDGTVNMRGFGWGYQPSLVVLGKVSGENFVHAPWVVATESWTSEQLGEMLAQVLDIALANPVDPDPEGKNSA